MINGKFYNKSDYDDLNRTVNLKFEGRQLAPKGEINVLDKRIIKEANGNSRTIIDIQYKLFLNELHQDVICCETRSYSPNDFGDARKKYVVPEWFPFIETQTAKIRRYIYDQVLRIADSLVIKKSFQRYPGFFLSKRKLEYLAGNKLICNNEIKHYPCDLNYRLADYDTSPECSEFVQQVMISCDSTLCSFLIASMVPYVLFLINPSERHRYDPVFFVHKKSELGQLFSTEICKVFFSMYVYKDDPTRPADMFDICCDPKDLNTASQFHDCSLYFDGLRVLGVKEIDKKSKLNAVTLINRKRGVNNSPSEGMNTTFSSSIVISSDFLFDKLPLLTRCVVIPHDTKCSKKTITWFKEHVTYLRGIKILFIQYLESNYEELKKKVETLLQQKHFKTSKYSSPSLCDSRTIMYVTAELFFEFYDDLRKTFSHDTEINGVGESKDSDTEDYWNSYETSLDPTSSSALDHEDDELDIFQSSSVTDMFFKRIDDSIEYTDKIISSLRNDWKQKLIDKFIWNLTSGKASFITTDIDRFQDDILNTENGFPQKFVFHDVEKKRFYVKAKHLENYFFTLDSRKFTGRSILNYFITDNGEELCLIDTEGKNNTVHVKKFDNCNCRFISIREKDAKKYIHRIYLSKS